MDKYKNLGPVHLYKYSMQDRDIVEQVGDLIVTEKTYRYRSGDQETTYNRRAVIKVKYDTGKVKKVYVVSSEEGEVFNNMVWLHEADTQRVAKILMDHENEVINDLGLRVRMHEEARDHLYRMYGRNDAWKV